MTCRCFRRYGSGCACEDEGSQQVEGRLKTVLPDELTPKEALALIYELRDLLGEVSLPAARCTAATRAAAATSAAKATPR